VIIGMSLPDLTPALGRAVLEDVVPTVLLVAGRTPYMHTSTFIHNILYVQWLH